MVVNDVFVCLFFFFFCSIDNLTWPIFLSFFFFSFFFFFHSCLVGSDCFCVFVCCRVIIPK